MGNEPMSGHDDLADSNSGGADGAGGGNDPTLDQSHLVGLPDLQQDPDATLRHGQALTEKGSDRDAPQKIGPYTLRHLLGSGGMGEVWVADQSHPVRRQVALKLIKPGQGSKEIITRFEAERQALALMNHPNIARILDAGTTDDGQPYFVMELVGGVPLTTYCDLNRMGIEHRLKLFLDVCSGVQHAHQKGIIHRDLKPGNIIVGIQDGEAVPKIIDFGLAKAMESTQRLTDQSQFTGVGQILGTLKYMSPEQASLDGMDIDTRTDIYSLGVILYELLTGSTPLEDSSLRTQAVLKVLELIREREPIRPSRRLESSTDAEISGITSLRQTDRSRLSRILAGDLDWIVIKALEKDRSRRYESASGFAADIRRYLNSDPVVARPPSLGYRITKFIRKNRVGVVAAGIVAFALMGGIAGTTTGLFRAEAARKKAVAAEKDEFLQRQVAEQQLERALAAEKLAEQRLVETELARKDAVSAAESERQAKIEADRRRQEAETNLAYARKGNEILGSVFSDLDPDADYPLASDLRNALAKNLQKAVAELEGTAVGSAEDVAEIQFTLGVSLAGLGQPDPAIVILTRAVETFLEYLGERHPNTFAAQNSLATAYQDAGRFEDAILLLEKTVQGLRETVGDRDSNSLNTMSNLAGAYLSAGRTQQALETYRSVHALYLTTLGPKDAGTLNCIDGLALACREMGLFDEALELLEETAELKKAQLGADHPDTLARMSNLALAYRDAGRTDQAISLLEKGLDNSRTKLGPEHPETLRQMDLLAAVFVDAGQLQRAIGLWEEAIRLSRLVRGPRHPETIHVMNNLAAGYQHSGQAEKALQVFEETLPVMKTLLGTGHPDTLQTMENLALTQVSLGLAAEANALLRETLDLARAALGDGHPNTLDTLYSLALNLDDPGEFEQAIRLFEDSLKITMSKLGPDHPNTLRNRQALGRLYSRNGQTELALQLMENVLEIRQRVLGPSHAETLGSVHSLGMLHLNTNNPELARPLLENAVELRGKTLGAEHADTLASMHALGATWQRLGHPRQAIPLLEKTVEVRRKKFGSAHSETLNAMNSLAVACWTAGHLDKSVPLLEELLQIHEQTFGRSSHDTQTVVANLGVNYLDQKRIDDAIPLLEEASRASRQFDGLQWVRIRLREALRLGNRKKEFESLIMEDMAEARQALADGSGEMAATLITAGRECLLAGLADRAAEWLHEGYEIRQRLAPDAWNTFNARSLLGAAKLEQGKPDEALPFLTEGFEGMNQRAGSMAEESRARFLSEAIDRLIEVHTALDNPDDVKKYQELRRGFPATNSADERVK